MRRGGGRCERSAGKLFGESLTAQTNWGCKMPIKGFEPKQKTSDSVFR